MTFYLFLIYFPWFIVVAKNILFWIYLWQLKEYHIGRFLDHFQTDKGKRLLFNKVLTAKFFILVLVFFVYRFSGIYFYGSLDDSGATYLIFFIAMITAFLYLLESVFVLKNLFKKTLKLPVLTKKTAILILAGIFVEILLVFAIFNIVSRAHVSSIYSLFSVIFLIVFGFLAFDILTPLIISKIVLLFQPFAVLARLRIIQKAKKKREQFKNLLVVGITGSYGKTSTKEFLYAILAEKFGKNKVLKTKEHQNSEIGISQCVLSDLGSEHEIFIVEMGAYGRGGIKLLCDIVKPKIGILTGINEQHMATFGSQENIIKTKYELIESLPEDGVAFFNAKNKYCLGLYRQTTEIKKFLYGQEAKFLGEENILGSMAVARELGMTEEEIKKATDKIENKFGGIKIKRGIGGLKIIDATFSANPDGVIAHLEYLKTLSGRKIIVMPCLIELGKASSEVHRRIGQKIAEVFAPVKEPNGSHGTSSGLAIITTKDRFQEMKGAASAESGSATASQGAEIIFMDNPKEIFEKIKSFCQNGDIILLESRVPNQLINLLVV